MRKIALMMIKFYQFAISPLMANHCRFYPSCSSYTYEAIETHGFFLWFLLRYTPFASMSSMESGWV